MKDLGPLQYFLGLEVQHCPNGMLLHQHKYTQELLSLAGLQDGNSVLTPMEVNLKLHKMGGDSLFDPSMYWQLVGSLNYLTILDLISHLLFSRSVSLCRLLARHIWPLSIVFFDTSKGHLVMVCFSLQGIL